MSNVKPKCECVGCTNKAEVLMEIGTRVDDWVIKTCDVCGDNVCGGCSETDDNGDVTCVDCATTTQLKTKKD